MLVEKTWKDGDICSLKLITSEEIVAKVTTHDASNITLQRPMILTLALDQQTQKYQLQMLPTFMISSAKEAKITISKQHILCIAPSEAAAVEHYQRSLQDQR